MNPKFEKWAFRFATCAWLGLIFWSSSQPGTRMHLEPPYDKIIHCCVFGVLGYLVALSVGYRWHALWIAPLVVSCLGAGDEFHQYFSPGRSVDIFDWCADVTGGCAAGVAWWLSWHQGERDASPRPTPGGDGEDRLPS